MRACTYCKKILPAAETHCPDDDSLALEVEAEAALPPAPAELTARFGRLEPYALGSTGIAYLGPEHVAGGRILVKVLHPGYVQAAGERARTKRELQKQLGIAHPHLPRVLDTGEASGRLWFAREFVPGETLAVRLRRRGPLALPEALGVVAQLATALDELHRQGLVHRDLKPGHVLLGSRAQGGVIVYLIDAGVAAPLDAQSSAPSYGTAAYAAPEVAAGGPPSFRSDLYALGCLLHELLAGTPPFSSPSTTELLAAQQSAPPPALDVEMPAGVSTLLSSLFAKEPRKRPFSAQQVRRALEPYLPPDVPPAPNLSRTARNPVPPPPSAAQASPDATMELAIEDLMPAAGSGEGATFPTQEIDLAELELMAVAAEKSARQRSLSTTARGGLTAPSGKRASQRVVDDDAPTTAFPTLREPELEQSSEIDLTPLIESEAEEVEEPRAYSERVPASPQATAVGSAALGLEQPRSVPPVPGVLADLKRSKSTLDDEDSLALSAASAAAPEPEAPPEAPSLSPRRSFKPVSFDEVAGLGARLPSEVPPARSPSRASGQRPPLTQRPIVLLWAAAALLLLAISLRVVRGRGPELAGHWVKKPSPAQRLRSKYVSLRVPTTSISAASSKPVTQPSAAGPSFGEPGAPVVPPVAVKATSNKSAASPLGAVHGDARTEPQIAASAPQPTAAPEVVAPAADKPQPTAAAEPKAAGGKTLTAAQAGKGYHRNGSPKNALGGVVAYKGRGQADVDYKIKAREAFQAGKYREAAEYYQRAAQAAPSDAASYAGLGASWLSAKEPDRAIAAYQRAVQLKPDVSGFQAALGRAYMTKGDRGRALAAYGKAVSLDPGNQAAKTALASLQKK